jgi:hypothetical protein
MACIANQRVPSPLKGERVRVSAGNPTSRRPNLASHLVHRVNPANNSMKSLSRFSPSPRLRVSA